MKKPSIKLNLELIKKYIKDNNLTEKEFCARCRITEYIYGRIMEGKVDLMLSTFLKIVDTLNCKFGDIVIPI